MCFSLLWGVICFHEKYVISQGVLEAATESSLVVNMQYILLPLNRVFFFCAEFAFFFSPLSLFSLSLFSFCAFFFNSFSSSSSELTFSKTLSSNCRRSPVQEKMLKRISLSSVKQTQSCNLKGQYILLVWTRVYEKKTFYLNSAKYAFFSMNRTQKFIQLT